MAARIICRCGPRDHVTPLRKEPHWLPIEARTVFKILCYTYKAIHGSLPDYMCDLVSVYNPKRCGLRSGNSSIKRLCTVKANFAKYGYMCCSLAAPLYGTRSAETFASLTLSDPGYFRQLIIRGGFKNAPLLSRKPFYQSSPYHTCAFS